MQWEMQYKIVMVKMILELVLFLTGYKYWYIQSCTCDCLVTVIIRIIYARRTLRCLIILPRLHQCLMRNSKTCHGPSNRTLDRVQSLSKKSTRRSRLMLLISCIILYIYEKKGSECIICYNHYEFSSCQNKWLVIIKYQKWILNNSILFVWFIFPITFDLFDIDDW